MKALGTLVPDYTDTWGIAYPAMGLVGEAGEVAEIIKKRMRRMAGPVPRTDGLPDELKEGFPDVGERGDNLDVQENQKLALELGDVMWYVAVLAQMLGFNLREIAEMNLAKLAERHGERVEVSANLDPTPIGNDRGGREGE